MQSRQQGPGKLFHVWEVAAAVLLEDGELHITTLTERIYESGLTTLGLKSH